MIFNFDDYIKQKFFEKYKLSFNNKKFKTFKKNKFKIVSKEVKNYSDNISEKFIEKICCDKYNKIIFYGINQTLNMSELFGICIYRKIFDNKDKRRYAILLISMHPKIRNFGYGTIFMNEILVYLKKNKLTEIVLHSLKESTYFYNKFCYNSNRFNLLNKNNYSKFIINYEGIDIDDDNIYFFKISF